MLQTNLIQNAHADLVCDASYDFYGTRLATAGLDQRIKIWRLDEQTGEWSVEDEWKAHDAAISRLSWAHPQHGQFILSASFDRTVRIWERSPPSDTADHSLNGFGANARGGERWVERARLTEAKGSVRAVEWAPKTFGMKLASIATDNSLRLYECLESGSGAAAPTSLTWSLVEEVDVPSLRVKTSPSPMFADASNGGADVASPTVEPSSSPASGGAASTPGAASTSPYMMSSGLNLSSGGATTPRPRTSNREADGGWDLSWCKEPYWGELCAVVSGVSGVVKIIQFPPAQRAKAVLTLDPTPSSNSSSSRATEQQHAAPSAAAPSYAHQARRSERDRERDRDREREYVPDPFAITTVAWAPSCGRSYHLIATGGRDGRVRVWKVRAPPTEEDGGAAAGVPHAASEASAWSASIVADFDDHKSSVGRVEWNVTGTVLSSAGNDGKVRLWRSTYGNVWRPMGSLDVVQSEEDGAGDAMEE